LGFAVEFPISFFHVHDPTSFAVGAANDKGFVGAGPARVAGFTVIGLVSAACEAVAFVKASVAEAEFITFGTHVVRGAVLAKDVAGWAQTLIIC
jgi:hypothetical protein